MRKALIICVCVNTALVISLCLFLFIIPAGMLGWTVHSRELRRGEIAPCLFRWHRALSPKYEKWARQRVQTGKAAELTTANISGTEWPLFGSVFYLWATEALQAAAVEDASGCLPLPAEYAHGAIAAAAALVADPNHATWVKQHWGADYLERENLFYRMLLISGLTSYQKLLGDTKYEPLLRAQAESLAAELGESPHGLLDDYPGQCYPVDIVPAIAAIRRADAVLGTDHSEFVARAIRGFQGASLDEDTNLPAYVVNSRTGRARDSARGVGLSFMLIWAPELWPWTARQWYNRYEAQFWQEGMLFAGFREFPKGMTFGWFNFSDVDAGPIVAGYGVAACAFGVGAARAMGDIDRGRKLTAEAMVACWPLPNGTLLMPRLLSNISDAPYLGEAAALFALTRRPVMPLVAGEDASLPAWVYVGIAALLGFGLFEIAMSVRRLWCWCRRDAPAPVFQFVTWSILLVGAVVAWLGPSVWIGVILLLAALVLPVQRKRRDVPVGSRED